MTRGSRAVLRLLVWLCLAPVLVLGGAYFGLLRVAHTRARGTPPVGTAA